MLVLILQIMALVVVTARIVDELEAKGRNSLLVKFLTPVAWFGGQFLGAAIGVVALAMAGTDINALTSPTAMTDQEMASPLFLLLLARIAGTLVAVGILYLSVRMLPDREASRAASAPA